MEGSGLREGYIGMVTTSIVSLDAWALLMRESPIFVVLLKGKRRENDGGFNRRRNGLFGKPGSMKNIGG